jgi:glycine oxidase
MATQRSATSHDVIVVGGGVIGMSIAWAVRRSGRSVLLVDPHVQEAASLVAAGMLAPVTEASFGEEPLLRLNLLAARRFPDFVEELEHATGDDVGLRRDGTLTIAYDAGDRAAVGRLAELRRSYGLAADELGARDCRRIEPMLSPDIRAGVFAADDWSVDNRRLLATLRRALDEHGVDVVADRVTRIDTRGERVGGVTIADGSTLTSNDVVLAAGAWSATIEGAPEQLRRGLRPVKGQLLRLRTSGGLPLPIQHTVRATVRGYDVYLVPRANGELVVGATSEERGFDRTVTVNAMHDLLRDATTLVPAVGELVVAETCAGLRPATRDNMPLVSATEVNGLVVATGHFRNGILQSAITGDAVLALLAGVELAPEWHALRPAPVGAR